MAAVAICSDFGATKIKSVICHEEKKKLVKKEFEKSILVCTRVSDFLRPYGL